MAFFPISERASHTTLLVFEFFSSPNSLIRGLIELRCRSIRNALTSSSRTPLLSQALFQPLDPLSIPAFSMSCRMISICQSLHFINFQNQINSLQKVARLLELSQRQEGIQDLIQNIGCILKGLRFLFQRQDFENDVGDVEDKVGSISPSTSLRNPPPHQVSGNRRSDWIPSWEAPRRPSTTAR